MPNPERAARRKRASILLSLLLLAAAVILTIISLQPGPDEPGSGIPPLPSTSSPGVPGASEGSAQEGTGIGTVECVLAEPDAGSSIDCPRTFTIEGSASGLFPGATVPLLLTIRNPNDEAISVKTVTVSVAAASLRSCDTSVLHTTDYAGPGFVVRGHGSKVISLPLAMSRRASDACQKVTFTLSYDGRAESV